MVGKKSGKALRDEGKTTSQLANYKLTPTGLERTDNNMELSSWPQIPAINQKNYYTYGPMDLDCADNADHPK